MWSAQPGQITDSMPSEMQSIIKEAGFIPGRRNQKYELFKSGVDEKVEIL